MAEATIAIQCMLVFGLGLWISLYRFATKQYYYGANDPAAFVTKLSRAHGNTTEFSPLLAVLTIFLALYGEGDGRANVAMALGAISRVLVVAGFLTSRTLADINPLKAAGAIGTYVAGLWMTALLVDSFR